MTEINQTGSRPEVQCTIVRTSTLIPSTPNVKQYIAFHRGNPDDRR